MPLFGKNVEEVMTARPRAITGDTKVIDAAIAMVTDDVGVLPIVTEDNRLVGVLTDRDIVARLVAAGESAKTTSVDSILSTDVITVAPDDDVNRARELMAAHQIRRLPVTSQDGELVGIIGHSDVASATGAKKTGELTEDITEEVPEPRVG